jgi:hypothetical protein
MAQLNFYRFLPERMKYESNITVYLGDSLLQHQKHLIIKLFIQRYFAFMVQEAKQMARAKDGVLRRMIET